MSRRRILVTIAAVVAVVAIGGTAWTFWPRGTTEVSAEEALEDFRERAGTSTEADEGKDDGGAAVPEPGVYTFAASGHEEVKLGPLPAETRPLPDTVTGVVVDAGDGCFELTVNLFAEHTEDTTYCADGDGAVSLAGHTKHQKIASLSPIASVTCDPANLVEPGTDATPLACDLSMSGGPADIGATLTGSATTGEPEQINVGGEHVATTPVTVRYEISGDLSGSWIETLWLAEDHFPVRIERSLDLSGLASFSESSTLELTDLTPST